MAEIRVEQKRRSLAWLWILLVLALVAAGVWYFYYNNGGVVRTTGDRTGPAAGPPVAALTAPGTPTSGAPARRAA
jgi:hypothetical protein